MNAYNHMLAVGHGNTTDPGDTALDRNEIDDRARIHEVINYGTGTTPIWLEVDVQFYRGDDYLVTIKYEGNPIHAIYNDIDAVECWFASLEEVDTFEILVILDWYQIEYNAIVSLGAGDWIRGSIAQDRRGKSRNAETALQLRERHLADIITRGQNKSLRARANVLLAGKQIIQFADGSTAGFPA